jgi:hypothetical protein
MDGWWLQELMTQVLVSSLTAKEPPMSLIKRPNCNNWYYLFQIQGRKHFGSTGTPKKPLAAKIEAKLREDAISRLVLGEVKPITLEEALGATCAVRN